MAISDKHILILRSIAKAGFRYESTKELVKASHGKIIDDEFGLGYLRIDIGILLRESPRPVVVECGTAGRPRFALLPLFCFPDRNKQISEFDSAFDTIARDMDRIVGVPSSYGKYGYPHRTWQYSYRWWSVPEAELVLVQGEFDIQDGFDVTLWILSAGAPKELPVKP